MPSVSHEGVQRGKAVSASFARLAVAWFPLRRSTADEGNDDIRPIADQCVDTPAQQPMRVGVRVDRPDLHGKTGAMSVLHEPWRDDARRAGKLRHLIAAVRRLRYRDAAPRTVKRPSDLFARGAGRNRRLDRTDGAENAQPERSDTHSIDGIGFANDPDDGLRHLGRVRLHLDDDRDVAIPPQNRCERRHVRTTELIRRSRRDRSP